jgi:signal peptidase I
VNPPEPEHQHGRGAPVGAAATGVSGDRKSRRRLNVTIAATAGALVLAVGFAAEPVAIPSDSMAPTLHPGDQVLVDKLGLRLTGVHRGDLVVFHRPSTGELMVKRVAALSGDEVGIEDGILVVNGQPVTERYLDQSRVDGVYYGPVTVAPGCVFMLGDNRANSVDSRTFGPVPAADLVGRVELRLWPPSIPH